MKIQDILTEDQHQSTNKTVNLNRPIRQLNRSYHSTDKGAEQGAYSSVKPDKNDPFMVRKTSATKQRPNYDPDEADGYWQFIDALQRIPEMSNNPFFPRVYGVKTITGDNGRKVKRAQLEKLEPYHAIDPNMLLHYADSIIDNKNIKDWLDYAERHNRLEPDSRDIAMEITSTFENAINNKNYSKIKNKNLVKALQDVNEFTDLFALDMHAGNIMFRRGQNGIQLVITDPLSQSYMGW